MKLFGLESDEIITVEESEGLEEASGSSESLKEWVSARFKPVARTLDLTTLRSRLGATIAEVSGVVSDQLGHVSEGVQITEFSVELGVTTGGEVGLFAKGRMDIAASFSVTFRVLRPAVSEVPTPP